MEAVDKLIATAEAEIGYLEKKSNKDLDSKTANAGSNNYTKYNRDVKALTGACGLHDQWCQVFVCWCFIMAFGLETAKKLINVITNYTPTGSGSFKKKGRYIKRGQGKPQRGDIVYFWSNAKGRIGHVGIVYKVTSTTVYTIEGNTSGASTLVTNGGGVRRKSYRLTSTYIDGYARVDYSPVDGKAYDAPAAEDAPAPTYALGDRVLYNYTEGPDVKELQQALIGMGYSCGEYGADGEYGDMTEMAVRVFQTAKGLPVTGKYDEATHKAMSAALLNEKPETLDEKARFVEIARGKKCYVRASPNTEAKVLGVVRGGEKLEYQGVTYENGWHLVVYKGGDACVSGKYGKLVEA